MSILAHDWNRISEPRIPRYPSKIGEKRDLVVSYFSWVGIEENAKHYEVTVTEEPNQWWSEEDNDWVELSCDPNKRGYELRASVYTKEEAERVAKAFIGIVDTNKNHNVIFGQL